jgi:3-hydroxybutyrate dehydrogenase
MLTGKTAIVTGSTSGIGLGIARALAADGADILLNGFGNPPEIGRLRQELAAQYGVRVAYCGADMTRAADIDRMIETANRELGRIDIVVNNAGIQHVAPVQEFPPERWNAMIAINLTAPFLITRAVLPQMLDRDWGRIINIASVHGLVASADKSAYVASKHGIMGLTKAVALETATTGVTCNAICPGWVLTPLVQEQIDALAEREQLSNEEASVKLLGDKQPSQTFTSPEQLGALVLYLCSDAACNMRGVGLPMDGGWLAQ